MTLGAFVVTYNRREALQETLDMLARQSRPPDTILVVDNANDPAIRSLAEGFERAHVVYEAPGENVGSAGGTSWGTRRLAEMGFDLIYSGDDDNPPGTLDTLERLIQLIDGAPPDVGGVGAVGARWNWRTGELERLSDAEIADGPIEADFVGGNHKLVLRREAVDKAGPPDHRLFFGYPDLEHCLRLRQAGFRLLIDTELMRFHRTRAGRTDLRRSRSAVPRRDLTSIWRNYYTTRNYIFMMRRTFSRPDLARREIWKALVRCVACWRQGPHFGMKFTGLQLRGVLDGYRDRLGRTIAPEAKWPVGDGDSDT
jgi:GT2 family glycosyltransferase